VPHRRRLAHESRHPAHITIRVVRGLPSLRSTVIFSALRSALARSSRASFRVVHYSVLARARTWLLRIGWQRGGPRWIDFASVPGTRSQPRWKCDLESE
jgi:hypothetical protein